MNTPRPFTPQTLADRWGCSAQHIRNLVTSRKLGAFHIGRMIRIPAAEVERFKSILPVNDNEVPEQQSHQSPRTRLFFP